MKRPMSNGQRKAMFAKLNNSKSSNEPSRPNIQRLSETSRNGYLRSVKNPKGTKAAVYIFQGRKPGFSAAYEGSNKDIPGSRKSAEGYARELARKGHKVVTIKD